MKAKGKNIENAEGEFQMEKFYMNIQIFVNGSSF
jgi:hypothetical protein